MPGRDLDTNGERLFFWHVVWSLAEENECKSFCGDGPAAKYDVSVVDRIKHERILLKRRARVWRGDDQHVDFELHCESRDLSISGIFLNTLCLLRNDTEVNVDLEVREDEWLPLNGAVARRIEFDDREHHPGFAVKFGELSDRSHETLLRYFVTEKIEKYTAIFQERFPHLDGIVSEQDIALIVNLWEDHRHLLVHESKDAPVKPAPRSFGGGQSRGIFAAQVQAARAKKEQEAAKPATVPSPKPAPVRMAAAKVDSIKPATAPVKAAATPRTGPSFGNQVTTERPVVAAKPSPTPSKPTPVTATPVTSATPQKAAAVSKAPSKPGPVTLKPTAPVSAEAKKASGKKKR